SPAGDRIERGGSKRFAAAQAETGVVPRAAHRVADDQSVDEGAVIVRAQGADGEELVSRTRQENVVLADAANHHLAGLESRGGNSFGEARWRRVLRLSHVVTSDAALDLTIARARHTSMTVPSPGGGGPICCRRRSPTTSATHAVQVGSMSVTGSSSM